MPTSSYHIMRSCFDDSASPFHLRPCSLPLLPTFFATPDDGQHASPGRPCLWYDMGSLEGPPAVCCEERSG